LQASSFADLYAVENDMAKLTQLYALYAEQKAAINKWSNELWMSINTAQLNAKVTQFSRALRACPLKDLPVYIKVENKLKSFKDSIDLLPILTNEALRPRHWDEIMKITRPAGSTGTRPDMKTLTLTKFFDLELHRFRERIFATFSLAQQEAKIEKELAKVNRQWSNTSFSLAFHNGSELNGYLLQDCTEIKAQLEDNVMTLQAMSNSTFAQAFFEDIRRWESDLTSAGSCITQWLAVQRKWMYLEGIFIRSEDIRSQMMEVAKGNVAHSALLEGYHHQLDSSCLLLFCLLQSSTASMPLSKRS
jgi:dynein heavy chain